MPFRHLLLLIGVLLSTTAQAITPQEIKSQVEASDKKALPNLINTNPTPCYLIEKASGFIS